MPPTSSAAPLVIDAGVDVTIQVASEIMEEDSGALPQHHDARRKETERRRLRESVRDLARIVEETTGSQVTIETSSPPGPKAGGVHVLIGNLGEREHGPPGIRAPYGQGYRVLVTGRSVALYGESDLGTSYAIYELLDQMGCRWFLPGPLGEVLPPRGPIALAQRDDRRAPSTLYRSVWFADDAWKRRNREGGLRIEAGHALEIFYVDAEDRARHPEWVATVRGRPDPHRLRWSSEALAHHVAERVLALHRTYGKPSHSLSPNDGSQFDESPEDRALDAGDFDPTMNRPSITDRWLVFANRVATHVAEREPDLRLGFLAYAQYTRPPVRERIHPNLVPQIAPITYSRAHPMSDDRVPGNRDLRRIVERWGELSQGTSMYFYGFFLAEPSAPNPMLTKWGHDVPYVLAHNVQYWQPETLPSFENSLHALYMGMRVAFDARLKPEDVYADIDAKLYGAAGPAMHAYWREVDRIWIETGEYSGGLFGHTRRFTPGRLAHLRELLETAKRAAREDLERRRIELADDSLSLFEQLMRLRWDFIAGRFDGLADAGEAYRARAAALGVEWKDSFAFTRMPHAPETLYATYYDTFQKPVYTRLSNLARTETVLAVQRSFRWHADASENPDAANAATVLDDSGWPTTDVAVDSWSRLGLHDWFGSMWYRTTLRATAGSGKRTTLTLSSIDGAARVFVNGEEARHVPYEEAPVRPESAGGPLRFDVTNLLVDGDNAVAIATTRKALNELGIGGLTGPVVLSRER